MLQTNPGSLSGIAVSDIESEYFDRGLNGWSDAAIVGAVAKVLSVPRRERADSFVLHAPLELAARAALLPRVNAGDRTLARLHIVAIAAQYDAAGEPRVSNFDGAAGEKRDEDELVSWFCDAVAAGDLDETEVAARTIATVMPTDRIASALADQLIPLTSAAAHGPIFLYHLSRLHPLGGLRADLLAPLAWELAREPDWRLRWIDELEPSTRLTDPADLTAALAETPRLGVPGSSFIHPLLMQVDERSIASDHLAGSLGRYSRDAAQAVLRVAAHSMLVEPAEHAPYGWTHCLTIPQAVLAIGARGANPTRALAVAATQVMAFRAAFASQELSTVPSRDSMGLDPDELATLAATSHDAHVVKYVLACLDAAHCDPTASDIYLGAARRLLDVWVEMGGDRTDPLVAMT